MSTWDCPNCFAPCGDAEKLVEHLVSSYLTERTPAPSSFSKKRKRRPSTTEDQEVDRQAGNEVDVVCPFPRCEHKKQYLSKFNLLRHFFIHYPDSEDVCLRCPCCLKSKENLGALSAHWEKSCKRKFGTTRVVNEEERLRLSKFGINRLINEDERRRLEFFENKKAEMGMRLTMALNGASNAPRKQARRGQPDTSESSKSGDEVDISSTAEPCQASPSKETSMPSARLIPGPGSEKVTNGAVSNPTSTVSQISGTSNSNAGQAVHTNLTANLLPSSDSAIASTAPALADIHYIPSTFDTNWSVVPPFGNDYDLLEVDNGWWMAHKIGFNLGHNSELMTDSDWYTDTDFGAWVLGFPSLPPLQPP